MWSRHIALRAATSRSASCTHRHQSQNSLINTKHINNNHNYHVNLRTNNYLPHQSYRATRYLSNDRSDYEIQQQSEEQKQAKKQVEQHQQQLHQQQQPISTTESFLGTTGEHVFTPCLMVDEDRLIKNIKNMQKKADDNHIKLRPHIKTHKSIKIAQMQREHGAVGITASKVSEAVTFLQNGFTDITLAYPVVQVDKARYLLQSAMDVMKQRRGTIDEEAADEVKLHVLVDNVRGIQAYRQAVEELNYPGKLNVMVEIDTGMNRCGVTEDDYEFEQTPLEGPEVPIPSTAEAEIREHSVAGTLQGRFHTVLDQLMLTQRPMTAKPRHQKLNFSGLLSYGGHAYTAPSRTEVTNMANEEADTLGRLRARINMDYAVPTENIECSVGSTPMELVREKFDGITEMRPGSYVFMDLSNVLKGLAPPSSISLVVLATVISDSPKYWIIDAGSKVLSNDQGTLGCLAGMGYGVGLPINEYKALTSSDELLQLSDASMEENATIQSKESKLPAVHIPGTNWNMNDLVVTRLSEEHGWIEKTGANKGKINLGDVLAIIPNHSCTVINLADSFYLRHADGSISSVPIDARGKTF